jgi:membrane AbrB-like protein
MTAPDLPAADLADASALTGRLAKLPLLAQAILLLAISVIFEMLLAQLRLPAARLLGPMAAGILFAGIGTRLRIPMPVFTAGQAIVGCMIAGAINNGILAVMLKDWPVCLAGVVSVIIISNALGWLLAWLKVLPGSTALWGAAPGGATAMVLMSESFGADMRLVAFMQYLRVVFVAVAATAVARLFLSGGGAAPADRWFVPIHAVPFSETLGVAAAGVLAGSLLRIPAGPLLVPLALGLVLHGAGLISIELPPWLLAIAYALVGWSIGFRFQRPILIYAAHAFPRVAGAILLLLAICGGLGAVLSVTLHIDPLTAYLATSPGGVDSVAIIAASSPSVNVPFVMAMQTARFLVILFAGPPILRLVARSVPR